MNKIQLDEDCNSKHIASSCQQEGKVLALRLPKKLRRVGTEDPDVFAACIAAGNPILTTDQTFVVDQLDDFPDQHPGVLIFGPDHTSLKNFTTHTVEQMLKGLKLEIPNWSDIELANSIVSIRSSTIEVSHCRSNSLVSDCVLDRKRPGWQVELVSRVAANAGM
jgi:hypothetical protein